MSSQLDYCKVARNFVPEVVITINSGRGDKREMREIIEIIVGFRVLLLRDTFFLPAINIIVKM